MGTLQFNMKNINRLKDILLRLQHEGQEEMIRGELEAHFKDVSTIEVLLIVYELKSGDDGITTRDVKNFLEFYDELHEDTFIKPADWNHPGHPLRILQDENSALQKALNQMDASINSLQSLEEAEAIKLREEFARLGQFYNHYNRKEKIIFPILERYNHYTLVRLMWGEDDRIRNFYKGTKTMLERFHKLDFTYIKKSYQQFSSKCKEMIFDEENFLLPILSATFTEDDWLGIARESDAHGYCLISLIEPEVEWKPERKKFVEKEIETGIQGEVHHPFGGGFLTTKEANLIMNHLPLEITFVDKNGIFKYFNEVVEASEMMFIRTPSAIGRNVANCHPPKSMSKVMRLIRDLKTKRKTSETMWFKKGEKYIHITYKGVFDEDGEFAGILEYVQDIQPFFELPKEVKKELSE